MHPRPSGTALDVDAESGRDGFFARQVATVARDLIGATLTLDGVGGRIVETEAYDRDDPASHSHRGMSARNAVMFGPVGRVYVYRIYGLHFCLNVVCGPAPGAAVLIRALEPTVGLAVMQARRGITDVRRLCAGPGCVCQALAITRALDGRPLDGQPLDGLPLDGLPQPGMPLDARRFGFVPAPLRPSVVCGRRIGLTKGVETPWRFGLAGSPFLSRRIAPVA